MQCWTLEPLPQKCHVGGWQLKLGKAMTRESWLPPMFVRKWSDIVLKYVNRKNLNQITAIEILPGTRKTFVSSKLIRSMRWYQNWIAIVGHILMRPHFIDLKAIDSFGS